MLRGRSHSEPPQWADRSVASVSRLHSDCTGPRETRPQADRGDPQQRVAVHLRRVSARYSSRKPRAWWSCAPIRSSSEKELPSATSRSRLSPFLAPKPRLPKQTLRSLYAEQSAPIFVLEPREALMVKYASNAFHALKVAFANEIAAVCQQAGVDAEAVMNVFCKRYEAQHLARVILCRASPLAARVCPRTCVPFFTRAKSRDLQLPLIAAILSSNEYVIERAYRKGSCHREAPRRP